MCKCHDFYHHFLIVVLTAAKCVTCNTSGGDKYPAIPQRFRAAHLSSGAPQAETAGQEVNHCDSHLLSDPPRRQRDEAKVQCRSRTVAPWSRELRNIPRESWTQPQPHFKERSKLSMNCSPSVESSVLKAGE